MGSILNTRQQGDYQIARHGWIGDYVDPMTFLDLWVTNGLEIMTVDFRMMNMMN